jgi:hypothetical protein
MGRAGTDAVPRGGLLLYDNMRFDLPLTSDQYEYQAQPGVFPLGQLERVRSSPDVAEATPLYFGVAKWKSGEGDLWPDVFMLHDAGATFDNSLIGLGPHQNSLKLLFMRAATRAIKPVLRRHGDV